MACSGKAKPHLLLLPFPETGHINPLMQLAQHLASCNGDLLITFVNTLYNHNRILRSNTTHLPHHLALPIRLVAIPDGLSDDANRDNDVPAMNKVIESVGLALEELIAQLALEGPPVTCIISDVTAVRTLEVAQKLGIPRVGFWPPCMATHAFICHASYGASRGSFAKLGVPQSDEMVSFPGLPTLPGSKLPWVVGTKEEAEAIFQSVVRNVEALHHSEWVLTNSVQELEPTTMNEMPPGFPHLCPVGPILPVDVLKKDRARAGRARLMTGLWQEEDSCLEWLDLQKPHSVIYVSMGSIATLSGEQTRELALGLEAAELPVLWVLRSSERDLPSGFVERTQGRIEIVAWAPQLLVLMHGAVGGFLTHCGWNSTIEALSMGIPMLVWPQLVDQFLNSKLVVSKWGTGIEMDVEGKGFVRSSVVEMQVGKLMQGPEGCSLRAKALDIRDVILKATGKSGSSHTNLQRFVNWIQQQADLMHVNA